MPCKTADFRKVNWFWVKPIGRGGDQSLAVAHMERTIVWIGFGEAASAFADGLALRGTRGFDRKTIDPAMRDAKRAHFARLRVRACDSAAAALTGASTALSLVVADQAFAAAQAAVDHLSPDAFWFDMNSVAPDTKRAAARAIAATGARYVDVAVMSPVLPRRHQVPLLVSGEGVEAAVQILRGIGFTDVTGMAGGVGAASSVKMIRSVMVKGIEALSAECAFAAEAAGVRDAVIASLDASWPGADWAARFDYNLDRIMVHGLRRAAEMEEVVKTLDALGTGAAMTRGTVGRQRAIGRLGLEPPAGLDAKLTALVPFTRIATRDAA